MNLMQAQRQEHLKYPSSTQLLKSSDDLGWPGVVAELLSHSHYEGPGAAAPADVDIGIVVRGDDKGLLAYKSAGSWQSARATTGSIRLRPVGRTCDEARIGVADVKVLHLYVPTVAFARVMDDFNRPAIPGSSIRHCCGVQDELINQIGLSVVSEMTCPTAAGRMLVETSSLLLAARLVGMHSETEPIPLPIRSPHRLDDRRLRRVLAYVEEHLGGDITVTDLANVACLSIFHFSRAFAASMGVPPHRYVSRRRLESAKAMIVTGRASLREIALDCRFSSESSFTRAFRRATGMTPAGYRRKLR